MSGKADEQTATRAAPRITRMRWGPWVEYFDAPELPDGDKTWISRLLIRVHPPNDQGHTRAQVRILGCGVDKPDRDPKRVEHAILKAMETAPEKYMVDVLGCALAAVRSGMPEGGDA